MRQVRLIPGGTSSTSFCRCASSGYGGYGGYGGYLLDELLPLLLELGALLEDDASQQLLLEPGHRHREVDDRHLRAHPSQQANSAFIAFIAIPSFIN